jgi:hypothetical protein
MSVSATIAVCGAIGALGLLIVGYLLHMGRTAGCQKSIVRRTYR